MRVIEQKMISAIRNGRDMTSGNTRVDVFGKIVHVSLHGNLIARVCPLHMDVTLAGWPTPTTRSRLNALLREFTGSNIHQSKHVQYLDREEMDTRGWHTVQRCS